MIHCCSLKAPKAVGHYHGVRSHGKPHFLFSASSESLSRILPRTSTTHRCCQQELGFFLGTQQGEPGTGRSLEPSRLRCCSHGFPEPAWKWEGASPVGSAEPASDLCLVHSSVIGAARLCFVFSRYFFSPIFKYHFALEP